MAMPPKLGVTVSYQLLADLSGLSLNAIQQAAAPNARKRAKRHALDINDLTSVCYWLAAHGKRKFRRDIGGLAAQAWAPPSAILGGVRYRSRLS